jgi:restriction system protein
MAFPSFRDMIEPLLRVLADAPEGLPARRAQDLVADRLELSEADRSLRVPGGTQVLFRHRTNWAHDRLKRARLSSTPRRGVWRLTPDGLELVRTKAGALAKDEIRELAKAGRDVKIDACMSARETVEREGFLGRDRPVAVDDVGLTKRGLSA